MTLKMSIPSVCIHNDSQVMVNIIDGKISFP